MDYLPGLKAILDNSATLVNWSLAVIGGSVAAIIGSSYERPKKWRGRLMYLLFPLAWIFLGLSVCAAQQISGRLIAAQLVSDPEAIRNILIHMNNDFRCQWSMLGGGLSVLFVWLLWFLVWLIFWATEGSEKKDSATTSTTTSAGSVDPKT